MDFGNLALDQRRDPFDVRQFSGTRIICVFPHPDDETLAAAGTIRLASQAGADVTLVCASRGESGFVRNQLAPSEHSDVGQIRAQELGAACKILGVNKLVFLNWPDGKFATLSKNQVEHDLYKEVFSRCPDIIITFGFDGAYGHVDHIFCTKMMIACLKQYSVKHRASLWLSVFKKGVFDKIHRDLRLRLPSLIDPAIDTGSLGYHDGNIDIMVDIESVSDVKIAAAKAHASQCEQGDPFRIVRSGLLAELLDYERFILSHD